MLYLQGALRSPRVRKQFARASDTSVCALKGDKEALRVGNVADELGMTISHRNRLGYTDTSPGVAR